ncbi:hypothetical protein HELRODRAFT_160802 [Helobdella robusta]|uniref:Uncharacterized protein n=1 Tax=Helobdella robusta TaxID=6412 RepID=T1EQQ6_HELRO|nr:hypothetical protein HELRODRAFT_160802 [Helobdella robusta]ESO06612.1 hypothetical protein HELRODRAFT_160802 [Helobdella robusta]
MNETNGTLTMGHIENRKEMAKISTFENLASLNEELKIKNQLVRKFTKNCSKPTDALKSIQNLEKLGYLKLIPLDVFVEFGLDTSHLKRKSEDQDDSSMDQVNNKCKKSRGLELSESDLSKKPSKGKIYGRKYGRFAPKASFRHHDLKKKKEATKSTRGHASASVAITPEKDDNLKAVKLDRSMVLKALKAFMFPCVNVEQLKSSDVIKRSIKPLTIENGY